MTTPAEDEARRALRESMATNRSQVELAEETLRLLRDGDRLNATLKPEIQTKIERAAAMEQRIINVLAGLVLGFLGWWSNNIWNTVQVMQAQVTTLNVELARNYVPRAELQQNFERIYNALERIDKQTRDRKENAR